MSLLMIGNALEELKDGLIISGKATVLFQQALCASQEHW